MARATLPRYKGQQSVDSVTAVQSGVEGLPDVRATPLCTASPGTVAGWHALGVFATRTEQPHTRR